MTRLSADLTNQVINFIYRQGGYAWRASSTGVYDEATQSYRTAAKKGVADVLAVLPPSGKLLAVEIKIGKDRLSQEQDGFLKNVSHVGGIAIIVKTFDQFLWKTSVIFAGTQIPF